MHTSGTVDPSPRAMRADARRNDARLLAAAEASFAAQGTDVSLEEIARRAGVGIGTLYRHFPTRQALLEALFREHYDALHAQAVDLLDAPSPFDALATWLRALSLHTTTYRGMTASLKAAILDETTELSASCRAMKTAWEALLVRAQQAGEVRPDADAMDLLKLAHAIAWATDQAPDGRNQADRLLAVVMDGLRYQNPTEE